MRLIRTSKSKPQERRKQTLQTRAIIALDTTKDDGMNLDDNDQDQNSMFEFGQNINNLLQDLSKNRKRISKKLLLTKGSM